MAGQRGINKRNGADGKCRSDLTVSKMIPVIMLKVPKSSQPSLWRNKTGRRSSATLKRAAPLDFPVSCTATTTCISHIRRTQRTQRISKDPAYKRSRGKVRLRQGCRGACVSDLPSLRPPLEPESVSCQAATPGTSRQPAPVGLCPGLQEEPERTQKFSHLCQARAHHSKQLPASITPRQSLVLATTSKMAPKEPNVCVMILTLQMRRKS